MGQSLWLDNITRGLLTSGTLRRYRDGFSITGLTSNPSISTGTKDPSASDVLYIEALAAPDTINTIPDKTLLAFADHGRPGNAMPFDGGDAEDVIAKFNAAGIDDEQLAADLLREGTESFVKSWHDLIDCVASKSVTLKAAG